MIQPAASYKHETFELLKSLCEFFIERIVVMETSLAPAPHSIVANHKFFDAVIYFGGICYTQ